MSTTRSIEASSEHFTATAIMNGAKKVRVYVSDRETARPITPSPDEFSLSTERLRQRFAGALAVPDDRRAEVAELLAVLARKAEAERLTAPRVEPAPSHDEIMLADRFVEGHVGRFLYTEERRQWSEWRDGCVWRTERTLHVFDRIRDICRAMADAQSSPLSSSRIASAATIAAVEKIARARRAMVADVGSWDADPFLLNTPGGVVNLRTGEMRAGRPDDRCRKMTSVAPNLDADCPKWRRFLTWAMCGDEARVQYAHRLAGHCLTGDTSEHVFPFLYGSGGNGKSVYTNTITGIMGDYAVTAPMETFAASRYDRHPTEIAMLHGPRLVVASETEEGRHWNEARLKELTGGTPITARFVRQDNFTFLPQFKPIVVGNHRPHFRHVDEAIRRRLHLVAFNATVTAQERNTRLGDELREEWPAILAWMIEGALEWRRQGLNPPASLLSDTSEYLAAEDPFGDWLEAQCEAKEGAFTASSVLFESWRAWAYRHGEDPGVWRDLRERFNRRGFATGRTKAARGIDGIRLRFPNPDAGVGDAGDGK